MLQTLLDNFPLHIIIKFLKDLILLNILLKTDFTIDINKSDTIPQIQLYMYRYMQTGQQLSKTIIKFTIKSNLTLVTLHTWQQQKLLIATSTTSHTLNTI